MPRHSKGSGESEIKQLTFFTDEENESITDTTQETGHEVAALQNTVSPSSLKSDSSPTDITAREPSDTEIIESEILPEQSIEAASLISSDETETSVSESTETETTETEAEPTAKRKKQKKAPRTPGSFRRESILIHFFTLVIETISRTLRNSFLAAVLTAYDKTAELFKASFLYHFFSEKPASVFPIILLSSWVRSVS